MDASVQIKMLESLGTVFFMIFLGYLAKPRKQSLDDMAKLVIDFAGPALIFHSLVTSLNLNVIRLISIVVGFAVFNIFLGHLFAYLVSKFILLPTAYRKSFYLSASYGNAGLIGIPIALTVFGAQGALFASVFDFTQGLLIYSIGASWVKGRGTGNRIIELLKNVINPPIIAFVFGLLVCVMNIPVPRMVLSTTKTLGGMTSPLAMIFVGGLLAQMRGELQRKDKSLASVAMIKLLILPLVTFLVLKYLAISKVLGGVILLEAATPTLLGASLLYQRYGGDGSYSASAVFVTTLLSILTIPLIMLLWF